MIHFVSWFLHLASCITISNLKESIPVILLLLLFPLLLLSPVLKQSSRVPPEGNAQEIHCSRERSRAAWQIIQDVERRHKTCGVGHKACGAIKCH
ncbi:unnamed protein product [Brassica napus]|uniref:(rape) hypothetical protein n=1 Tax=Brassica napus TaxID=3708 RepID=A0A816J341_BRANA|nr:unnamed protein product [Brassica napus]